MSSAKAKPLSRTKLWSRVFAAEYPMVELYRLLSVDDKARRKLALKVASDPDRVGEAFSRTVAAIGSAVTPQGSDDRPAGGGLIANKDTLQRTHAVESPLARRPRTAVDTSSLRGVAPGELDLVFLDREVALTRTPHADGDEGVAEPRVELVADLLVAAPDGTIGVGEIKLGPGRDLFSALIQVLAGVSLVAPPAQIARILSNYALPPSSLAPGPAPKLDAILITVPRAEGSAALAQLDVLARGFVPVLLAQPEIAGVVRQIVGISGELVGEDLQLTGSWVERA